MHRVISILERLRKRAFGSVDIASLVFFRIAFGLLMAADVWRYYANNWVATRWLEPRFLFKYYGFSWVQPWPGHWLYVHWIALAVLGLFIAAGFFYRVSAAIFFLSYTYFFLLDEAWYVNHTYLICLFSFLLVFLPAHRAFSIDAWLKPQLHSQCAPAWTLWLLRFQMGIVYFYGGLAKLLSSDWLQGEPMRQLLGRRTDFPLFGRFFRDEWMVYLVSYGGLLLDLLIVPFLLWRRTRMPAFCLALAFHLTNARWFPIGIFPWLAIAATTLFFSPSWPRRIVQRFRHVNDFTGPKNWKPLSLNKQRLVLALIAIYAAIQVLAPLRHFLSSGGVEWMCSEHRFSWRMMLVSHYTRAFFYVTDPNTGATARVPPARFLSYRQCGLLAYLPDLPLQAAQYLAVVMPRRGPKPLRVEARIFVAINGRPPRLYLDPNVDLAAEPRPFLFRPRWLLRIDDPLPPAEKRYKDDLGFPSIPPTTD
ncbi:MAG: HTTM domain-containing protein [Verrucomicrobiota bacterium]|nr:HTTM domain-containing protein [Verrucomicrobiota bacterium]